MLDLETALASRHPQWLRGRRARITRSVLRTLVRATRVEEIEAFVAARRHLKGFALVEATLEWLDCRYLIDQVELARVPESGALLIVANHPLGALDALSLLHCIGRVRRDVRVVANDLLMSVEGLRELLLPLRVFGGGNGARPLRAIESALAQGRAVIVFPAGEVSRLGWRGVRDRRWQPGVARMLEQSHAPLLPVHIKARNSALFYGAAAAHPALGTALLPREMLAGKRLQRVELRIGLPVVADALLAGAPPRRELLARMRALVESTRRGKRAPGAFVPVAARGSLRRLLDGIGALERIGETPDGRQVLVGRLDADSAVLDEVARLRELTFRMVGEGSGRAVDRDAFDTWYDHILLWDPRDLEIVGAYRVVTGARALDRQGISGFYTHTLFEFDACMLPLLERSLELGRSFVQPRYWGSRSLDELWCGIGAYLRQQPQVRYLFGPVSMSAALPLAARAQLVGYYEHFHGDPRSSGWVRARLPFQGATERAFTDLDAAAAFAVLRDNLAALGARPPMLYKQYTELCEPGGVRFLGFNVDREFADAVDGLVLVDLARMLPHKRRRYLEPRPPRRAALRSAPEQAIG